MTAGVSENLVGIDEVGRGAWAGPLLVVAARLKKGSTLPAGITDSKKLSRSQRVGYYEQLKNSCEWGEGWVQPSVIDKLGLTNALILASTDAIEKLRVPEESKVIIDGNINFLVCSRYTNSTCQTKADLNIPIVGAASIIAKVLRDQYMYDISFRYPEYGFAAHVGYGTVLHRASLKRYGSCELHRLSYAPIARLK